MLLIIEVGQAPPTQGEGSGEGHKKKHYDLK
jgi:hypothetical protein